MPIFAMARACHRRSARAILAVWVGWPNLSSHRVPPNRHIEAALRKHDHPFIERIGGIDRRGLRSRSIALLAIDARKQTKQRANARNGLFDLDDHLKRVYVST
jgi:hypothetical protein